MVLSYIVELGFTIMALKHEYQRVARRSLESSRASLGAGIQENSAFLSYHAFESTGCALSSSCGLPVGPQVRHRDKINHFRSAARCCGNEPAVARLAVRLASIRNQLLYPMTDSSTGVIVRPEDSITLTQAGRLRCQVTDVVNWVDTQL